MPKVIILNGIAWDHPRGYEPLRATSIAFAKVHPEVQINWDIRSLKEFGDMPVEDLTDVYDLITIDHPYMGQAHANKLLLPLEKYLHKDFLKELEVQSVGLSAKSYYYKNCLYALPIDAAAMVSATREDLMSKLDLDLPVNRKDLLEFYQKLPDNRFVAWPLCPTDLWCSFLTLCAQDGGRNFMEDRTIDEGTGIAVLEELKLHLEYIHPKSINWNPIQLLDEMAAGDQIIYSPILFGYTNYSRMGYAKNLITFHNSPSNPKTDVSTILGGVGLGVSSKCIHPQLAVAYVNFVANAKTQETVYVQNGGQPYNLKAWLSKDNNTLCNNFFFNTIETMHKAYVRPRHVGWNIFQEQGAELLHHGLVKDIPSSKIIKDLNQLYQSIDQYE